MEEKVIEIQTDDGTPMVHQIGKLLVCALAGFAAQKVAAKGYDAGLNAYRNKFDS